MKRLWRKVRGHSARADGFTLIELLLAASLSLIVLGVGVGLMTTAMRSQPDVAEKAGEIQEARAIGDTGQAVHL